MKTKLYILFFILCPVLPIQAQMNVFNNTEVAGSNYKDGYSLVWSDEFDGSELKVDVWNYDFGTNYPNAVSGSYGWGNNELQYYTQDAVRVSEGCLVITAQKRAYSGKQCVSGRINTAKKVYFQYGIVEASIKIPKTANGLWPTFWMMGNDHLEVNWPQCGEIDIMEMGSQTAYSSNTQDRYFDGACHYGNAWNDMNHTVFNQNADYSLQDGEFHLFTCIWNADEITMYYDLDKYPLHEPFFTLSLNDYGYNGAGNYFHKPFFIILNMAIGGDFPGIWDISGITALNGGPVSLYVDYVRVYQRGEDGEEIYYPSLNNIYELDIHRDSQKLLRDGVLYILRGEKTYTVMGQEVK